MIDTCVLTLPNWHAPDNIVAFTTQLLGGISGGSYYSLNMGSHVGDDQAAVDFNRSLLPNPNQIHWLNQTHSDVSIRLPNAETDADAAFTESIGLVCAVMTADCLPILVTDVNGEAVCAIHAGWRGLENEIIKKTINKAFLGTHRNNLMAWIGPNIRQCHYEVDLDLAKRFDRYSDAYLLGKNPQKAMLNLETIAVQQLNEIGIAQVALNGECTYRESDKYFSFRRASHKGFNNCGRMVSLIMRRE